MNKNFAVRGGSGNIIEPKLDARPQDNLYLAVNSEWIEKLRFRKTGHEWPRLMVSMLTLKSI